MYYGKIALRYFYAISDEEIDIGLLGVSEICPDSAKLNTFDEFLFLDSHNIHAHGAGNDFYARLHAAGICESAGLVLCSIGFLIYEGFSATGLKIFAVFMAVFIASPIGTHIIIRVAFKQSMRERENAGSAAGSPAGTAEKEVQ